MQVAFDPAQLGGGGVHGVHPGDGQPPDPVQQIAVAPGEPGVDADGARDQPRPDGQHQQSRGQVDGMRRPATEDDGMERVAGRRAGPWRQGFVATDERERVGGEPEQGYRQQIRGDRRSQQRDGGGGRNRDPGPRARAPAHEAQAHHGGEQGSPAEGTKLPRPDVQDAFHRAMVSRA
jgi:hypothetical protein